ncbi:MAG: sodium-translocating pyrophosphatase, partial [Clostridiales Family XIII bacterium]|nr:sodium-translocating pyrophosphatase [Clostridiales Family XIII bacterium]
MKRVIVIVLAGLSSALIFPQAIYASEADLIVPDFSPRQHYLLSIGIAVCIAGFIFGLIQYTRIKKIRAHKNMLDVAGTIYETCKTYLLQQGKFLALLFAFIGACIVFYFGVLDKMSVGNVVIILMWAVVGIL